MRKSEITVEVNGEFEKIIEWFRKRDFAETSKYKLIDCYYSKCPKAELNKLSYEQLIKNSFMLREIIENGESSTFLQYKDKTVDENGNVVSEEKIRCRVEGLEKAKKIFDCCGVECWCELRQNIIEFKKEEITFSVQEVEDLGLFIEVEENESMLNMDEQQKRQIMIERVKSLGLQVGNDFSCKKVYKKFKKEN